MVVVLITSLVEAVVVIQLLNNDSFIAGTVL